MNGICIDWGTNAGNIKGDDGKIYSCHMNAIQSQDISLDVGKEVTFEVGQELITKRPIAVMVKKG